MHRLGLIILVVFGMTASLVGCSPKPKATKDMSIAQLGATYNAQLAMGYLKQGDIARAKIKLNKAVSTAPDLPLVQYSLGYFLEQSNDFQGAEKAFKRAVRLDPKAGETHNNYGAFLCRMYRYQEAEQAFLRAVEDKFYPGTAKAYENAGLCALEAGKKAEATHYFERALQQDPFLSNSLLELAELKYNQGAYKDTVQLLQRYRKRQKLPARGLWVGIQAARKAGDRDTAASYALVMKHKYAATNEYKLMQEYLKE